MDNKTSLLEILIKKLMVVCNGFVREVDPVLLDVWESGIGDYVYTNIKYLDPFFKEAVIQGSFEKFPTPTLFFKEFRKFVYGEIQRETPDSKRLSNVTSFDGKRPPSADITKEIVRNKLRSLTKDRFTAN